MLASTVQFSNNDQPPITPNLSWSSLGPAPEGRATLAPSDTQQRARHPRRFPHSFHTPKGAVLEGEDDQVCRIINVPPMSNQHRTGADVLASDLTPRGSVRSAP
jgi:hypothetical protein